MQLGTSAGTTGARSALASSVVVPESIGPSGARSDGASNGDEVSAPRSGSVSVPVSVVDASVGTDDEEQPDATADIRAVESTKLHAQTRAEVGLTARRQ